MNGCDYAPFFRDGLLYLPPKTIKLLLEAGLHPEVAEAARHGLALDDDRKLIGEISSLLEKVLPEITTNSACVEALQSNTTYFIMTGKRAAIA